MTPPDPSFLLSAKVSVGFASTYDAGALQIRASEAVLLALVASGTGRQEGYVMVQRNAMRAWKGEGDFRALLGQDADVSARLPPATLDACFDLTHSLRHVDEVISRAVEASR